MHIAMVTPRHLPFVGGVETHVDRLSTALAQRGHTVEIFTQRTDPASARVEHRAAVTVRRYPGVLGATPYPISPRLWRAVWSRRQTFDVIHGHGYHALASLVGPTSRGSRRPFVFTPHYHATGHTPLARALHPIYRPIGGQLVRRANTIISVSQVEADLLEGTFPPSSGQTRLVIPNGVDIDAIVAAEPFELTDINLLCVGRLAAYKNVDRVIDAVRLLPVRFHLWIVGDGPERGQLADNATPGRVTFLGRVSDEDLQRWYRSADVCVNLSAHEAFGIVLLEQLAAGGRVVASSIPAHREVAGFVPDNSVRFVDVDIPPDRLAAELEQAAGLGRPEAPQTTGIPTWERVAEWTEGAYISARERERAPTTG
ncbi:MAG TPA: glycosyltransferase family 4 protein [Solirubrobacteraceae bacterium]|jgi:glycosyltransferase involved in cell wall biosynthesis|nr:glycosyltransferase family 4 protein [Solirubrobacteraceae bacterium]